MALNCYIILTFAVISWVSTSCYSLSVPGQPIDRTVARFRAKLRATDDETALMQTFKLTTSSGKPLCRYALGGAARSKQPSSLPLQYRDILYHEKEWGSPFYFYYNPNRYPEFLSGVAKSFVSDELVKVRREDVFIASGGSEYSISEIDQRLENALQYCGGDYLDAFVLEYICPDELVCNNSQENSPNLYNQVVETQLSSRLETAILHLRSLVKEGKIRYILASTHSHFVGAVLANSKVRSTPSLDAIMLRYNLSHKSAAESLSFPYALQNRVPVIAFTTTRWNRLLSKDQCVNGDETAPPSPADCIKFALRHPAVEIVLHSSRDEEELENTLQSLILKPFNVESDEKYNAWREYGQDEIKWNMNDDFDEFPNESGC